MLKSLKLLYEQSPIRTALQHAEYLVVDDPQLKLEVKKAAFGQHKVETASAAIIVLGNLKAYENAPQIYEGLLNLSAMSREEYDGLINTIYSFYGNDGQLQRDEAIRSGSLSAMMFMLIAKSKGWDTCPMIGFDPEQLKQLVHIPDHLIPVMMITIGKEKTSHPRPRGYRKPISEFVRYGTY